MVEVVSLPPHLLVFASEQLHRFPSALAALLPPCDTPLGLLQFPLRLAIVPGILYQLAAAVIRNTFNPTSMPVS